MAEKEKQEVLRDVQCLIDGDIKIDGLRTDATCGTGCEPGCFGACINGGAFSVKAEEAGTK